MATASLKEFDYVCAIERFYTRPDVIPEREKPEFDENALVVLKKRYLKKDDQGNVVESPQEMLTRVAENVAEAEERYEAKDDRDWVVVEFYNLMARREFIPNSPTLMNAGRDLQQLAACFVLPVDDSMESIFQAVKEAALIHKSGGKFLHAALQHHEILEVLLALANRLFNAATETIKQGGTRRGANMGILRIDHPDIEEFITCKRDNSSLTNFNISVAVTSEFMKCVQENKEFPLINPHSHQVVKHINARQIFHQLIEMAWKNGDPGIVFIDRINEDNPTPQLGEIESTNPCGEQPLLPYEACNLGSINLEKMLRFDEATQTWEIDWNHMERTIYWSVRFLDDVIDMSDYPLRKVTEMARNNRKIGLGLMGWAGMLFRLDIPYDSDEALALAEKIMKFIQLKSKEASAALAEMRGVFPNWDKSIYVSEGFRIRNATTTTIAPTGTISIIAGCTSGIEPLFALCFYRNVLGGEKLIEVNSIFKEVAEQKNFYSEELMQKIAEVGSIQNIAEIPEEIKRVFITAHEVTPEWHIRHQAMYQKYVDNAVSKTINFPKKATLKDVEDAYTLAYEKGCKGITIYRDGSRDEQVLNIGVKVKSKGAQTKPELTLKERPQAMMPSGQTLSASPQSNPPLSRDRTSWHGELPIISPPNKAGVAYLLLPLNYDGLTGRNGSDSSEKKLPDNLSFSSISQLFTPLGLPLQPAVPQTEGDVAPIPIGAGHFKFYAMVPGVSESNGKKSRRLLCPECNTPMRFEEGCYSCPSCGYSRCS